MTFFHRVKGDRADLSLVRSQTLLGGAGWGCLSQYPKSSHHASKNARSTETEKIFFAIARLEKLLSGFRLHKCYSQLLQDEINKPIGLKSSVRSRKLFFMARSHLRKIAVISTPTIQSTLRSRRLKLTGDRWQIFVSRLTEKKFVFPSEEIVLSF